MWAFSGVVADDSIEAEGESTGGADKGQAHCPGSVEEVVHLHSLNCGHVVYRGAMFDGVELSLVSPRPSVQTAEEEGW